MNSDKFDRVVLDLLYDELDELTAAAAKRHVEQSARARNILSHLETTRKLSRLPVHAPPRNFAASVVEREPEALSRLPLRLRWGRVISMLAGYAMRPQLSMGALLLLMIGSSLMFLRARPGQHSAVQVTGRGTPEADVERVVAVREVRPVAAGQAHGVFQQPRDGRGRSTSEPRGQTAAGDSSREEASLASPDRPSSEQAPAASEPPPDEGLAPFDHAVQTYRGGHYVEAQRLFERISRTGEPRAAEAALYSAQATRNASGCGPAVGRFERVRLRFPGTGAAYEAAWRAAKCMYQLGDVEGARQSYESLLQVASHAQRALRGLEALGVAPRTPEPHRLAERIRRGAASGRASTTAAPEAKKPAATDDLQPAADDAEPGPEAAAPNDDARPPSERSGSGPSDAADGTSPAPRSDTD